MQPLLKKSGRKHLLLSEEFFLPHTVNAKESLHIDTHPTPGLQYSPVNTAEGSELPDLLTK